MRVFPLAFLGLATTGLAAQAAPAAPAAAAKTMPAAVALADLKGNWRCTIEVEGGRWPVSLQIITTDEAKPMALIENLSPGDRPISAAATLKSGKLHLEVQGLDAGFDGKISDRRDEIAGTWRFAGLDIPCDLKLQKPAP